MNSNKGIITPVIYVLIVKAILNKEFSISNLSMLVQSSSVRNLPSKLTPNLYFISFYFEHRDIQTFVTHLKYQFQIFHILMVYDWLWNSIFMYKSIQLLKIPFLIFFLSQSLLNMSFQSMFRSRFCEQMEKLSATRELLCMGQIYHSPFISSLKLIIGFYTIIVNLHGFLLKPTFNFRWLIILDM